MEVIRIDEQLCTRCGACAEVCTNGVLSPPVSGAAPVADQEAAASCLRCGHCTAVCPAGALALAGVEPSSLPPAVAPSEELSRAVEGAVLGRRSIREFTGQPLPDELLARLIDSARFAPTGSNAQEVRWLVVNGREKVREVVRLAIDGFRELLRRRGAEPGRIWGLVQWVVEEWNGGRDAVCWDASALVLVLAPEEGLLENTDCALALGYLDLLASASGLGTCWAGILQMAIQHWPPLAAHLGVPAGQRLHGAMMLGYPRHRYHRVPPRRSPAILWKA